MLWLVCLTSYTSLLLGSIYSQPSYILLDFHLRLCFVVGSAIAWMRSHGDEVQRTAFS